MVEKKENFEKNFFKEEVKLKQHAQSAKIMAQAKRWLKAGTMAPKSRIQASNQLQKSVYSDTSNFLLSNLCIPMPSLTLPTIVIFILKYCPW